MSYTDEDRVHDNEEEDVDMERYVAAGSEEDAQRGHGIRGGIGGDLCSEEAQRGHGMRGGIEGDLCSEEEAQRGHGMRGGIEGDLSSEEEATAAQSAPSLGSRQLATAQRPTQGLEDQPHGQQAAFVRHPDDALLPPDVAIPGAVDLPWPGAWVLLDNEIDQAQLQSMLNAGGEFRFSASQPRRGPPLSQLVFPLDPPLNPNGVDPEDLADRWGTPPFKPGKSNSKSSVRPGKRLMEVARDLRSGSLKEHRHHVNQLEDALPHLLSAAKKGQDDELTPEEVAAQQLPPITSAEIRLMPGGVRMLLDFIESTRGNREEALRGVRLEHEIAASLCVAQSLFAAEDTASAAMGEMSIETAIRVQQSMLTQIHCLLSPKHAKLILFPQQLRPFTADRGIVALEPREDWDGDAELQELEVEADAWRMMAEAQPFSPGRSNAEIDEEDAEVLSGAMASRCSSPVADEGDSSDSRNSSNSRDSSNSLDSSFLKPRPAPVADLQDDADEVAGERAVRGVALLELKGVSAFELPKVHKFVKGLVNVRSAGDCQGLRYQWDGLHYTSTFTHPNALGTTQGMADQVGQMVKDMLHVNLHYGLITCMSHFLILQRSITPENTITFQVSPVLKASNPILPQFKAQFNLSMLSAPADEVAACGDRRSERLVQVGCT